METILSVGIGFITGWLLGANRLSDLKHRNISRTIDDSYDSGFEAGFSCAEQIYQNQHLRK